MTGLGCGARRHKPASTRMLASAETAEAGVLEFPGNSVRFRYPLLRSAVYHGASAIDRRHAHHALSEAGNPELRVWHLAAAAIVPDEKLAAELQHTAERAGTRGGYAARAALLRRSADLTPDDARRAEREVALADARLMAGDPVGAQNMLGGALPRLTSAMARCPGATTGGRDPLRAGQRR